MNLLECLRSALIAIRSNKLRSLLTMLGIIIGISAVITITMLGSTLSASVSNAVAEFGGNSVNVEIHQEWVRDPETGEQYFDEDPHFEEKLISLEMFDELEEKYPGVYRNATNAGISYGTLYNPQGEIMNCSITGGFEGYINYQSCKIVAGRNLTLRDNLEAKSSAVVSSLFVEQYCKKGEEPIGQTISITEEMTGRAMEFTIVGVYKYPNFVENMYRRIMETKPDVFSTEVVVPLISGYQMLSGEEFKGVEQVTFLADPHLEDVKATENLDAFFEEKYKDSPKIKIDTWGDAEDFAIVDKAIGLITIVISIIAAISLLVGGVGVMNIMLVSVTERTREIGIRKALGAKRRNIRTQFIIEAVVICLIGGIIGILLGLLNGELICIAAQMLVERFEEYRDFLGSVKVQPSFTAIMLSFAFSTLTGVFFGWYPANKASKMNPIDALRYD